MRNINLDLLFVSLLAATAAWTQFHASDLPMVGAFALVPLFGYIVAAPKKSAKRVYRWKIAQNEHYKK